MELRGIGDALVGEPVGEQQHASGRVTAGAVELLESLEPAAGQVGAAAGDDPVDGRRELARVGRTECHEQIDVVVVGHDGELVGRAHAAGEELRARSRRFELVARHRPGAVDHEREMQRWPVGLRCVGRVELEHAVDVVLALDGEQLVVEAEVGLHGRLPRGVVSGQCGDGVGQRRRCDSRG